MNKLLKEFRTSVLSALWIMILTFPLMVIKVNTIDSTVNWRWINLMWVGIGTFILSWLWRYLLDRKENGAGLEKTEEEVSRRFSLRKSLNEKKVRIPALSALAAIIPAICVP